MRLSFRAGDALVRAERGEESPADSRDTKVSASSRGFLAVLSPYQGIGGSE